MTASLALLRARDRLVTPEGTPTVAFQHDWQRQAEEIELKANSADVMMNKGVTLTNAVDDAAAAAAGVPVGSFYRNGSVVMLRVA